MISVIAEHSVDLDLLPKPATILDLGCRGFGFTDELRKLGHRILPIDIDQLPGDVEYFHCGISDYIGFCNILRVGNDLQATRLERTSRGVSCWTLESFMKNQHISFADLIKIDVEGEEYKIIMSLDRAPAKQLSIEFHLHTGIYGEIEVRMMEDKLKALGYEAVSHVREARHCAGFNFWDSLFILKQ